MKKQEVLNVVMEFAYEQNARCVERMGKCLYRGPKGDKCFIGCLIPDDMYNPHMESIGTLCGVLLQFPELQRHIKIHSLSFSDNIDFFEELQAIHDNLIPEGWEKEFKSFAIKHKLDIEVTK